MKEEAELEKCTFNPETLSNSYTQRNTIKHKRLLRKQTRKRFKVSPKKKNMFKENSLQGLKSSRLIQH